MILCHFLIWIRWNYYYHYSSGAFLTEIHYADGTAYQCNVEDTRRMTDAELDTFFPKTKLVSKLSLYKNYDEAARGIQIIAAEIASKTHF